MAKEVGSNDDTMTITVRGKQHSEASRTFLVESPRRGGREKDLSLFALALGSLSFMPNERLSPYSLVLGG